MHHLNLHHNTSDLYLQVFLLSTYQFRDATKMVGQAGFEPATKSL